MKRKLKTGLLIIGVALMFSSCEELFEDCQICRQVTYEGGVVVSERQESEYCGTELATILATPPVTVGNTTTRWECD